MAGSPPGFVGKRLQFRAWAPAGALPSLGKQRGWFNGLQVISVTSDQDPLWTSLYPSWELKPFPFLDAN